MTKKAAYFLSTGNVIDDRCYLRRGGCIVWLSVLALASSTG